MCLQTFNHLCAKATVLFPSCKQTHLATSCSRLGLVVSNLVLLHVVLPHLRLHPVVPPHMLLHPVTRSHRRLPPDIPLKKAVAGVRVGFLPGQGFVVNPTAAQMGVSQLDLMIAGTADAVLMIEGFCDWLSEEQMLEVRLPGNACWLVVCGTL